MSLMNYPSIEQVVAALGKHTQDQEVQALMNTIGIYESEFWPYPDLNDRKLWTDQNNELQLNFQDIGALKDIPYHDIGEGPWVLTAIIFWSSVNSSSKQSYGGSLPYGVNFDMSRKEVHALHPDERIISSERVDAWGKTDHELVLNYDPKTQKIRSVSLRLPPPPL